MRKLSPGTRIATRHGEIQVIREIGSGTQGSVYAVTYNGEDKALKWYRNDVFVDNESFLRNLESNVRKGSPSSEFLWPLDITERAQSGCFGYVMNLAPTDYLRAEELLIRPSLFPSFRRVVDACLNIVVAFWRLHAAGYVYRDISSGNFFINPNNGKVLICDNDNASPEGYDSGIRGTPRFMAPEVVVSNVAPTEKSDRYSLAAIVFCLLLLAHPLEGARADVLDAACQLRLYGTDPLFIFDDEDDSNRPIDDGHSNALRIWPSLPVHMQDMFRRAFAHEALMEPARRPSEAEWVRELTRLRSEIVCCPSCGRNEVFLENARPRICDNPDCGARVTSDMRLELPLAGYALPVADDMRVYSCQTHVAVGAGHALAPVLWTLAARDGRTMGLKNLSDSTWQVLLQGRSYEVPSGQIMVARAGMEVVLGDERARVCDNSDLGQG